MGKEKSLCLSTPSSRINMSRDKQKESYTLLLESTLQWYFYPWVNRNGPGTCEYKVLFLIFKLTHGVCHLLRAKTRSEAREGREMVPTEPVTFWYPAWESLGMNIFKLLHMEYIKCRIYTSIQFPSGQSVTFSLPVSLLRDSYYCYLWKLPDCLGEGFLIFSTIEVLYVICLYF